MYQRPDGGKRWSPALVKKFVIFFKKIIINDAKIGVTVFKTWKGKKDKNEEKGLRKRIEVGQRNNSHFEIINGVADGDRIFVPSMKQLTQQDDNDDKR